MNILSRHSAQFVETKIECTFKSVFEEYRESIYVNSTTGITFALKFTLVGSMQSSQIHEIAR